ncbi:MAG: 6-carboxytetrahydropterin synthase [Bacteroidales bacterium]|nr:6-carboxytetrahydropterin synthase [Bacteroidales bacterium]
MTSVSIVKEFTWSMAHMLANHIGKCKNIHGHTYKMQIEIARKGGGVLNKPGQTDDGMVLEFEELKTIINTNTVEALDHAFLYWVNSTDELEHEIASLLKKHGRKVVDINYRPTAENLALDYLDKINNDLAAFKVEVVELVLWESPTSYARVLNR